MSYRCPMETERQTVLATDDRDARLLAAYEGQSGYMICDKHGRGLKGEALLVRLRWHDDLAQLTGAAHYRFLHDCRSRKPRLEV